jgi:uncharacterized protein
MPAMKILSIDGGGIRGVFTAVLLDRILAKYPALIQNTRLFAGTSTGGILALGLALGYTPAQLRDLYRANAADIFDDSFLDDLLDLKRLAGAEYSNKKLKKILKKEFGSRPQQVLGDIGPQRVLISTFDLDNQDPDPALRHWKPKFFHNFPGADADLAESIVDVAVRTSAAPTYFPSYQGYVDGGVVANNPSMAALSQVLDSRSPENAPLPDIALLSLGTGTPLHHIEGQTLDWGYSQWVKPLIDLMMDGSVGLADYQCTQLLSDRYHRLAPTFPPTVAIKMDDHKRVGDLIALANSLPEARITEVATWLTAMAW